MTLILLNIKRLVDKNLSKLFKIILLMRVRCRNRFESDNRRKLIEIFLKKFSRPWVIRGCTHLLNMLGKLLVTILMLGCVQVVILGNLIFQEIKSFLLNLNLFEFLTCRKCSRFHWWQLKHSRSCWKNSCLLVCTGKGSSWG